jgi:hypothetical protein
MNNNRMYEILLCIGIIGIIVVLLLIRRTHHKKSKETHHVSSIHGLFLNKDMQEGSRIYAHARDPSIFYRHKQGTSSYLDEEWKRSTDSNVYTINSHKYAIFDKDHILVYEDDKLTETLQKNTEICIYGETEGPTYDNFSKLYDLVEVSYDQTEELADILSTKKACATINDVHIHTGTVSNLYMARGMFAFDKKRTCFYYVSRDILPLLVHQVEDINTLVLNVNIFRQAGFVGAMS